MGADGRCERVDSDAAAADHAPDVRRLRARDERHVTGVRVAFDAGVPARYGLLKRAVAVKGCRDVTKRDMKFNDALPVMKVDAETYKVTADGEHLRSQPASVLPLAQRYFLF